MKLKALGSLCNEAKVVKLYNAKDGTQWAGTGGTIYVPQALLSSYPTATNWSVVHGWGTITWTAIEGSYYETHHADGSEVTA